jgi:RNA methyltransferase, TrmH family
MIRIESKDNLKYRSFKALKLTKEGRLRKQVFLEGFRLCDDAMRSGAIIRAAVIADNALQSAAGQDILSRLPAGLETCSLPDRLFAGLSATENPQGFALVCDSPLLEQPAGPPHDDGLYLIADGISDPGNLGNMIRTADAFALDAVLLTAGTVYPLNDKVLRAAMGSCFHIPLVMLPDLMSIAAWLASGEVNVELVAADPDVQSSIPADNLDNWPVPVALVIGNEAFGLSDEARQLCRRHIAIPMPGRAESLNAASAAAILCYEMMLARAKMRASLSDER